MPLIELASGSLLLKGSPSTLFHVDGDTVYIIDPGHGRKRAKQIRKEVEKLKASRVVAVVTHYHSDHIAGLAEGLDVDEVIAPSRDAPAIRDPLLRTSITFGLPLRSGDPLLLFKAPSVRVDTTIEPGGRIGGLEILDLSGHTPGQIGVLTPSGVLYAADSLFGPRVLDTYGVPYHLDPCMAADSLRRLLDMIDGVEALVPSHGPVARGEEARRLVEANLARVEEAWDRLLGILREPASIGEAAAALARHYGVEATPGLLLLLETAVRGYIACRRSEVEAVTSDRGVLWRASRS